MEAMITFINQLAQEWCSYIVSASIQVSFLIVILWFVASIFRNKSASFLYLIWIVGLIKLILPPQIQLPEYVSGPEFSLMNELLVFNTPIITTGIAESNLLTTTALFFIAWTVTACCLIVYLIHKNYRLKKRITDCRLVNLQIISLAVDRNVKVFIGPQIRSPFTKGVFLPEIYLPEQALRYSRGELNAVVLHELAHIKRWDTLIILLQNFVQIIYFFHPLVWLLNIKLFNYREKACDDLAIQSMYGNSLQYGKYLLNSIDRVFHWCAVPTVGSHFHQSRKSMIKRFEYILKNKESVMVKVKFSQKLILVGLIALAVLLSYQDGGSAFLNNDKGKTQRVEEPPPPPPPSEDVPPPPPPQSVAKFVEYDKPPMPEGGFSQIQKHLVYPEAARKAGVEGKVLIELGINEQGKIIKSVITKSFGNKECDEAALKAVNSVEWNPAIKDDEPLTAYVLVPVAFRLSTNEKKIIHETNMPMPVDGLSAIYKKLKYPADAKKSGLEGKIVLKVDVNKKGEVVSVKIFESFDDDACNKAAINAVKSIDWRPGMKDNKPVDASVNVPVVFRLN